jgi:hypothetical protein
MFKFLRKYSSWILAVGGTLLMITFLAPQAITGLSEYSAVTGGTWATVGKDGTKITIGDFDLIQRQTRMIDELGPQNPLNQIGVGKNPGHWYLLSREAKAAGLVPGPSGGFALAQGMAASAGEDVTPEAVISNLGARARLTMPQAIETFSEIAGVSRLISMVAGAGCISDLRMRSAAARKSLGVAADVVVFDAKTDTSIETPTHSEEALSEQLTAHAGDAPGAGEKGFGYRIPDRFKLEWLMISRQAIEDAVAKSPALDTVELRKAFIRDPLKFGTVLSTANTSPVFEDYKDKVQAAVLKNEVEKTTRTIAKFASDQLQFPRRGVPSDGIHVKLPENWSERSLSFTELAKKIQEKFGVTLPAYTSSGEEWLTASSFTEEKLSELSTATTDRFGQSPMRAQQVVEAIKEFGGSDTVPVQANIAFPPLETPTGDLFILRVIETDPSHEPRDLADVRENVTTDLDAIFAYGAMSDKLTSLVESARAKGLREVANELDLPMEFANDIREANLQFLIQYGVSIGGSIPGVGSNAEAISQVIDRAAKLDPTKPIADQPIEDRVFGVLIPDQLKIMLVKIDSVSPLTKEQWDAMSTNNAQLQQAVARDLAPPDPADIFSFDALKDRHSFIPTRDDEETDEDTTEDADADEKSTEAAA